MPPHDPTGSAPRGTDRDAFTPLARRLATEAASRRLTFSEFMTAALYDPEHGYYARGARIGGEGGDFYTAPSLPGFANALARGIADAWTRLGEPASFTVVELGAGMGTLAENVSRALADAGVPARYVTVEPHAGMAEQQRARGLEVVPDLAHLGRLDAAFVLANEVVDALPVHRVVQRADGLKELYVTYSPGRGFAEEEGPLSTPAIAEYFEGVDLDEGHVAEANLVAPALARAIASVVARGYVTLIDYGDERPLIHDPARGQGTVRAFHRHRLEDDVFARVGEQDVTASVDFTWLRRAFEDAGFTSAGFATQGAALLSLGILDEHARLAAEDPFAATKAKSLFLPGGFGDLFKVLVMARDAPVEDLAFFRDPPKPSGFFL